MSEDGLLRRADGTVVLVGESRTTPPRRPVRQATKDDADLAERLERVIGEAEAILEAAKEEGDVKACAQVLRELRGALVDWGRATGQLDDRPTVEINLTASSEWVELRTRILAALQPFPEARAAVAAALAGAEPATAIEAPTSG